MNELAWPITKKWAPFMLGGSLAGYTEVRDGMTFATIHGAGHMAPQFKRAESYYVVFNFIKGKPIWSGFEPLNLSQ